MLERCVGETLHVANDMTLATASVTSVAQNIIFYVSEVIDIIYIYKLSKKISYHNSYENDSSRRLFFATLK